MNSAAHAHYLAECLSKIEGFALKTDRPYFHEFLMSCPVDPEALLGVLSREGILGGLPVGKDILWCATELNSKKEIDRTAEAVRAAVKEVSGK